MPYKQNVQMNQSAEAFFRLLFYLFVYWDRVPSSSVCPVFSCILIFTFIFKAGQAEDFLEPLLEAKKAGLKLALHLSEVNNILKLGWRG